MTHHQVQLHRAAELPFEDLGSGVRRHVAHGGEFTQLRVRLAEGAVLPTHEHVHEQYTLVISGALRYRMAAGLPEEHLIELRAGDGVFIPSMVPHEAVALDETETLEIFVPGRPDFTASPLPPGDGEERAS
jgi:quercetin dioxygenase-like cupin family protein